MIFRCNKPSKIERRDAFSKIKFLQMVQLSLFAAKIDVCLLNFTTFAYQFLKYRRMWIAENLKHLRAKHGMSQQELSAKMEVTRTSLSDYERGHTQMSNETLVKVSEIFDVSLDVLMKKKISFEDLEIARNKDLRILAISVDGHNRSNIELVDTKAEAGYLEYYGDPQYIRDLPKISVPGIPEGTYRGFEIHGDSMLPLQSGSIVICSYIESFANIKPNATYVVISSSDGVVYKRVRPDHKKKSLTLISDNPIFPAYQIGFGDVQEIWQYFAHLSFQDINTSFQQYYQDNIQEMHKKINEMHSVLIPE